MFYLVLVVLGARFGSGTKADKDLSVFHEGDRVGNFKESSAFHRSSLRRPKFIDVYTNYPDKNEVEKSFHKNYNQRNKNQGIHKNSDAPIDRKDTLNFQNLGGMFSSQNRDVLDSEHGNIESDFFYRPESNFGNRDKEFFEHKNEYTDRNNYYYPHNTQIITKTVHQELNDKQKNKLFQDGDRNNFVLLQSQMAVPDSENYGSFYASPDLNSDYDRGQTPRPHFLTKRYNFTGGPQYFQETVDYEDVEPGGYSHVQKIPFFDKRSTTVSPENSETDPNKYEELDLSHGDKLQDKNLKKPNTRKRINELLKKYLTNLFVKKYANKKVDQGKVMLENNVGQHSQIQNTSLHQKDPKIDQESKFFSTDVLWDLKNKTITKIKNLFSIFTVIKFNNTECNATNWAGTWQGVCYTSTECDDMNGTAFGNCASGYGVCCVFRGSCDDSSSRNCSYFKSPNYPDFYPSDGGVITPTTTTVSPTNFPTPDPRLFWYHYNHGSGDEELDNLIRGKQTPEAMSCTFQIIKSDPEVNQIRIDFIDLDLASPTNGTCTNERLVINGQNANDQIPVICGYNTGQHVYVDVSELTEPLELMVLSTTNARKRFKLRICQYTDSCSTSQSNCLQYYTGVSGVIQSFNYDQAAMFNRSTPGYFNNLNYAICIRREAGYCSITYTNVRNGQMFPFQLTNRLSNGQLIVPSGQAGVDILNCPDDYIIIDGVRLCGDRFNDGSTLANFSMNAPVTDTSAGPIVLNVRTNNNVTGLGFKLYYRQTECPESDK